jgi:Tol biopolymer transport system component
MAGVLSIGLLAPSPAESQLPRDPVERARRIAEIRQNAARQLTLFDRQGNTLAVIGSREMYNRPVLSLDGKRVAVIKGDLDKETNDLWVLDVATGNGVALTATKPREGASTPVWSPDGSQVAYVRLTDGYSGLYRKASNGEGAEELLYRHNAPIDLTDWSLDGRFLSFFSTNLGGGALYSVPLEGAGERKPIEILSNKFQLRAPRISPDGRFVAYVSNPAGREEIYVRPFDPVAPAQVAAAEPWQVSDRGGIGMPIWRRDGKELYYLGANQAIMAVDVTTTPTFKPGPPRVLFRLSEGIPVTATMSSVSRDGERILIAVPPPQLVQITVFDRQGQVVGRIGQPGSYAMPMLSPDGTRVAVLRNDRETGNRDIWAFDVTTGRGTPITDDTPPDDMPVWSPDGKHLAYLSIRGSDSSLYRKASDGAGQEELLFRYTAGAFIGLTDWSRDGKFLTFFTGMLAVLPVGPEKSADRKEIEWLREEYDVLLGRFSPDSRFLAYLSNEANVDVMQVYVRPFDAAKPEAPGSGPAVQVSKNGAIGMVSWRQDSRELYFMTRDWEVMAVEVSTAPTFQAGTPRLLFKVAGPLPGPPGSYITRDGERFIIAMPATPTAR